MTSDQFVAFVEEKLTTHGATKVVPDEETLATAYRAFVRAERARARFVEENERGKDEAVDLPPDLVERARMARRSPDRDIRRRGHGARQPGSTGG